MFITPFFGFYRETAKAQFTDNVITSKSALLTFQIKIAFSPYDIN